MSKEDLSTLVNGTFGIITIIIIARYVILAEIENHKNKKR